VVWWLYIDRSTEAGAQVIAGSADPGRLGRSAYHLIHPVMVGGSPARSRAGTSYMHAPEKTRQ
jgi:hypothetical protein